MEINKIAKEIHQNAVEHGWWEDERSVPEIIALCHSELSEALEEYRSRHKTVWHLCRNFGGMCESNLEIVNVGKNHWCKCPETCQHRKPEGIAVELVDCAIRIFDYLEHEGMNIEALIAEKHAFNKTRPYKHGGKRI